MTLVLKLSGKVLEEIRGSSHMGRQVAKLAREGHRLVLVHGGGKQLTAFSKRLRLTSKQYQGRRVTDEATLEAAKMVFSAVNRDLVASLLASDVTAIGISSFDVNLVRCRRRPPISVTRTGTCGERKVEKIDFGLVGEVEKIEVAVLSQLWQLGWIPVVSCLCSDSRGQILNINADTLAAELAIALRAERLISVSDVDGIYLDPQDPSTIVSELSAEQAKEYLRQGALTGGMVPKVEAALNVLEHGVAVVQILSGLREGALLEGLEGKSGTFLRKSSPKVLPHKR